MSPPSSAEGFGPLLSKDFTSGCTMEAREFRDMHEQFWRTALR
jgi:hypothetical protein